MLKRSPCHHKNECSGYFEAAKSAVFRFPKVWSPGETSQTVLHVSSRWPKDLPKVAQFGTLTVCVYIYIYIYLFLYIYICIYLYVYLYVYIYCIYLNAKYMYISIYVYIPAPLEFEVFLFQLKKRKDPGEKFFLPKICTNPGGKFFLHNFSGLSLFLALPHHVIEEVKQSSRAHG